MINGTPVYMYQDCSVLSEGDTDHWLRTNWIFRGEVSSRIFVELKFTIRDCKSFRGEMINTVAGDNIFTARDVEVGSLKLNTEVCSIGNLQQRGFYLAFQNSGACVALVSVRVYYKTCTDTISGLAHFPETLAGPEGLTVVSGICLKNATETTGVSPKMHCSPNGEWLVPVGRCTCVIGFEEVKGRCVGKYPRGQALGWIWRIFQFL
ncbi:hypothetical protein Chor_007413, partial [Crotalus horridus]